MATLNEMREERHNLQKAIADLFEGTVTAEIATEIRAKNAALAELNKKIADAAELDEIKAANAEGLKGSTMPVPHPGEKSGGHREPRVKSVRQLLNEAKIEHVFGPGGDGGKVKFSVPLFSPEYQMARQGKTLLTLSDIAPQADLMDGVVGFAREQRTTGDMMLQGTTQANTIQYYEMTTRTNAAAEVAEGEAKGEAALDFTLRTDLVETIAVWLPVTKQALADVDFLESMINGELTFMVREREELQLLVGDGTSPNISGILDRTGIQTQAKGADSVPDAIFKAITLVRSTGFAEPTGIVLHPNDWQAIRLLTTVDGIYIWGPPSQAGDDTIWGLPVRVTTNLTENTGLVGAFRPYSKRVRREDVTVTLSTEHDDYFTKNKVAILAEERLALQVTRPAAFATVTGI